jgi:hypothetical protein
MKPYQRARRLYPTPLDFPTFEFRLLTLLPLEPGETEAADKVVRCTLRYDFLIERYDEETGNTIPIPEYVALSYCWGDPLITRAIVVNGMSIQVTTNLEAALRALRALKYEYLWIDALCINQEDLLERGLQVMRMGLIFSNASKVLAWIGDEADDSQMVMAYLLSNAQIAMHYNIPIGQKISSVDIPESVTEPFSALFRRPFWKRVWVIQEISKGREVHVLVVANPLSGTLSRPRYGAWGS